MEINLSTYESYISKFNPIKLKGSVSQVVGLVVETEGPLASIGELCTIIPLGENPLIQAEVVGFREKKILLMPFGDLKGISPGCEVIASGNFQTVKVSEKILGRVIDGAGCPLDGKGILPLEDKFSIYNQPLNPLKRKRIKEPLATGIRAIDGLLACGKGQRMGIFAGSGVGKSVLLGMIARNTSADVNVVALIGERGREVREFIEKDLGEEGLARSVVVAVTSDKPPLLRRQGPLIAMAIAEYFRDKGKDVMFMMDSVTRFAMAQREIGLAIGEPPTTKGYTPSVFAMLPKLLERAGTVEGGGSITGLFTVLVDADDMNEPIADASRSILDGHIVLSRAIAAHNHYPAIDILNSLSRLMTEVVTPEAKSMANRLRDVLATYKDAEDIINIGAYVAGSSPSIDYALKMIDPINKFLQQGINERVGYQEVLEGMKGIVEN
ncbi:MAG: flagellar protein export ATPase FliI [bacterium]